MERKLGLLLAVAVVLLFVAGLLIAVNSGYFTSRQPVAAKDAFSEERVLRGDSIAFRFIPGNVSSSTYIVSYEVRGEGPNVTGGWSVAEKKFEEISPSRPIEILVPRVHGTTYTLSILISDNDAQPVYKGTSTIASDVGVGVSVLPGLNL